MEMETLALLLEALPQSGITSVFTSVALILYIVFYPRTLRQEVARLKEKIEQLEAQNKKLVEAGFSHEKERDSLKDKISEVKNMRLLDKIQYLEKIIEKGQ